MWLLLLRIMKEEGRSVRSQGQINTTTATLPHTQRQGLQDGEACKGDKHTPSTDAGDGRWRGYERGESPHPCKPPNFYGVSQTVPMYIMSCSRENSPQQAFSSEWRSVLPSSSWTAWTSYTRSSQSHQPTQHQRLTLSLSLSLSHTHTHTH